MVIEGEAMAIFAYSLFIGLNWLPNDVFPRFKGEETRGLLAMAGWGVKVEEQL